MNWAIIDKQVKMASFEAPKKTLIMININFPNFINYNKHREFLK